MSAVGGGGWRYRHVDYASRTHVEHVARLRNNVKAAKSSIVNQNKEHFAYSRQHCNNRKVNPYRDARNAEINLGNRVLVGHIATTQSEYHCEEPFRVPSLNYYVRKKERNRIHRENLGMANRIIESQIRTSQSTRKEIGEHSRMHDTRMDSIAKLIPSDGARTGYHDYIASGYTHSAGAEVRRKKRLTKGGKLNLSSTAGPAGPLLPPLGGDGGNLSARQQAFQQAMEHPAPTLPNIITLSSSKATFLCLDAESENKEGVLLKGVKEEDCVWKLSPAPPGTHAAPTVPPLYYIQSTQDRWLSAETSGKIYTAVSHGWGACTSKWVMEDVGAGRFRVGAWRNEDTTTPGGYLCIDSDGNLRVMQPPEDADEAATAELLFHWQLDQ